MDLIRKYPEDQALCQIKDLEAIIYSTVANNDLWKDARTLWTRHMVKWTLAELSDAPFFEKYLTDNRTRVAAITGLTLPKCNIQVLGESGGGKTMFMRALIALLENKRQYQRGVTHFVAKGEASASNPINFSDEQNTPANDICRVLPTQDPREKFTMQIAHNHTDINGERFPHTLFFSGCRLLASCPTPEFFDFETDTKIKAIEDYKTKKKPRYYRAKH